MSTEAIAEGLRYPVGKFDRSTIGPARRAEFVQTIADLPRNIAAAVDGLTETQLDRPYRPGGWSVRQTVHHIADSHLNSMCRFKLALTEDTPTITPYEEARWAELADSKLPVDVSLSLIDGLHQRWATLLDTMSDADFQREFNHPETGKWTLNAALAMYAWHSRHHTAHITRLRDREGW
ncbi:MAG TPA: bacillithiol transferase BstA [Pyrinomonadaceae bacterium]|jgi:uncharacterized damage-inducible protein DinB